MTNGDVTRELRAMLEGGKLDSDDALRLLLVMTNQIQVTQIQMKSEYEQLLKRVEKIEERSSNYPSLIFMWHNQPRRAAILLILIFLVYTLIVTPWMISDIRHVILDILGLPTNLGLPTP